MYSFSNFSVIIVALLEPWTEIDNFTFVMCVSLAFNRMLCSFFVYPVNGFAVATNRFTVAIYIDCSFFVYPVNGFAVATNRFTVAIYLFMG